MWVSKDFFLIHKNWNLEEESMSNSRQEEINIHVIKFKEDVASVQKLHEAQGSHSIQPMIHTLLRANSLVPPIDKKNHASPQVSDRIRDGAVWKEHSSEGAPWKMTNSSFSSSIL